MFFLSNTVAVLVVYLTLEGVATHTLWPIIKGHGYFFFFYKLGQILLGSGLSAANKNKALFNFATLQNHSILCQWFSFNKMSFLKSDHFNCF